VCSGQKVTHTFYSTKTCLKGIYFTRNSTSNCNIRTEKKWQEKVAKGTGKEGGNLLRQLYKKKTKSYSIPRVRTFSVILDKIFLPLLYPSYHSMIVKFQSKGISVVLRLLSMNFYLHQ